MFPPTSSAGCLPGIVPWMLDIDMASQQTPQPARIYAACTHVTMVRVYSYILRCDSCGNSGPFGWLYRCSQDQEEILRDSICSGEEVKVVPF